MSKKADAWRNRIIGAGEVAAGQLQARQEYKRQWEEANRERLREKRNADQRRRRQENPEKYLAKEAAYRERHREELRQKQDERNHSDPERTKEIQRKSREKNRAYQKRRYQELRAEVITAYGGACVCCGESHLAFLTIDHVFNDGNEHRNGANRYKGANIYRLLKKEGFPKDRYQVLCYNCNCSKQHDPEGHKAAHPNAILLERNGKE